MKSNKQKGRQKKKITVQKNNFTGAIERNKKDGTDTEDRRTEEKQKRKVHK